MAVEFVVEDGDDDANDAEGSETNDGSKEDSTKDRAASVDDDIRVRVFSVLSLQNSLIMFCLFLISLVFLFYRMKFKEPTYGCFNF